MGKCGQHGQICPTKTKTSSNVEKWSFLTILRFGHFWKCFNPQLQNFKNMLPAVEISADSKIWRVINLDPKKSSNMRVRVFWLLLYDILSLTQFSEEILDHFWPCKGPLWPHRGVSGGRQKFLTHKKNFPEIVLSSLRKAYECSQYPRR